MIGKRAAAVILALGAAGYYFAPAYKANWDYVRSASALAVLPDLEDAGLLDGIRVEKAAVPGMLAVTGQAARFKNVVFSGVLAEEDTNYSFRVLTRSHCFELEPGCLEIQKKNIVKAVSVKVQM